MKKLLVLLLTASMVLTLSACCLKHDWTDATCIEPKTCAKCGKTEGEALGHTWTDATCTEPKTCSVCGETEGEALGHTAAAPASCTEDSVCSVCGEVVEKAPGHQWADATEAEPKTCTVCGVTEGEPLPAAAPAEEEIAETEALLAAVSDEEEAAETAAETEALLAAASDEEEAAETAAETEALLAAASDEEETAETAAETEDEALSAAMVGAVLAGTEAEEAENAAEEEVHTHVWDDATCAEPKTCSDCGETEGEALGHQWKDATCTEAKTCTVCGETEGEALGHQWKDATCTEPKTCTACGETEGEALGHTANEATCTEDSVCSVCGEVLEKARGHEWIDATYEAPKTCAVCGETEGEPLCPFSYIEEDGKLTITGYLTDIPEEIVIPAEIDGKEVAAIGDSAFAGKAGLVSITMPESVVRVGERAFADCPDLTTVNMPSAKVAEFKGSAFENCGELTGVMGDEVFYTGFTTKVENLSGEWDGVRGTCFHGVYTDVFHLDEPIRKCTGFTLDTTITKYNGNPFREWDIYLKRGSLPWKKAADYVMHKEKAGEAEQFTFVFEKPISFDSIAVVDRNNNFHTVYYTVHLHDVVRYFSVDGK